MGADILKGIDAELWALLRREYGEDLKSAFIVVTTMHGAELCQASLLVYPPGGRAETKSP
jgi:hypothetical protein